MDFLLVLLVFILFIWAFHLSSRIGNLERALRIVHDSSAALTRRISGLEVGIDWNARRPSLSPFRTAGPVEPAPPAPMQASAPAALGWSPLEDVPPRPIREVLTDPVASATARRKEEKAEEAPLHELAQQPEANVPAIPRIDWERWLGIRGAAATGAAILVVALLYFLRYSMDAGWLTPTLRVAFGGAFSVACVGAAQARIRASHPTLGSWMTGAGIAGLYASVWAGQHVVGLFGPAAGFLLTVAITVLGVALALRTDSLPIALLGTVGGFAAPLSLHAGGSQPLGIVLYVALLDIAMVTLAIKRRWWALALLSMIASAAYHLAWSAQDASRPPMLQIGIVLVFAAVFGALPALAPSRVEAREPSPSGLAVVTSYVSLLLSYVFVLQLATEHAARPYSIVTLVFLMLALDALAIVLSIRHGRQGLMLVAIGATGLLTLAWMGVGNVAARPISTALLAVTGCVPFVIAAARDRRVSTTLAAGTSIAVASVLVVMGAFYVPSIALVVALVVLAGATALLARTGGVPLLARLAATGLAATLAVAVVAATIISDGLAVHAAAWTGAAVALGAALFAARGSQDAGSWGRELREGVGTASILLLVTVWTAADRIGLPALGAVLAVFGALALVARGPTSGAHPFVAFLVAGALALHGWLRGTASDTTFLGVTLALGAALALGPHLVRRPASPRHQALVVLLFSLAVLPCGGALRSISYGGLALAAAVASLVLLVEAHRRPEARDEAGEYLGVMMLGSATAAVLLGLDGETRIWALAALGAGTITLDRRLEQSVLAAGGVTILLGASAMLLNPSVLSMHPRADIAIVNWVTPLYLVPAACCLAAFRTTQRDIVAKIAAGAGLLLVFVWANVCVLDMYATGRFIGLETAARQGRDLGISVVWGVYGVGMLVLGVARNAAALRWTSLGLILLTAGKVFLYDLANLQDLYRVAALVGLAASLIVISVLYQRFVFRRVATSS